MPRPGLSDGFVVVRPLEPDDAPAVAAACQDPLIQERCYFVPSPYRLEDAERFIAEARRELVAGTVAHCALCAGAGVAQSPGAPFVPGELLGAVNLVNYPEREAAEIGYWVKREARGRGVATAALRLVMNYAFEQVGVERLEIMAETPTWPRSAWRRSSASRARASPAPIWPHAGSATATWSTRPTAASTRSSTRSCAPSGRRSRGRPEVCRPDGTIALPGR